MTKLLLGLLFTTVSFSQSLTGKLSYSNTSVKGNIYIRDVEKANIISEYYKTDSLGNFNILLKKTYKNIKVEVSSYGYDIETFTILNIEKSKAYTLDFNMKKKSKQLDEILIKSEKVVVKKDTVVYNPRMYSDGTERKLGEILTKIPGFEVNNGNIKYHGKVVSALKIEADDLFGKDYAVGTKNISLRMIDKIEAIDNFSENPLLKGIESSDKVAINLKLKKGSLGFSGDGTFSSGFDSNNAPKNDANINDLIVSKNYKSFFQFGYNNVGENYSQIDPIYDKNRSFFKEEDVFSKSLLNDIKTSKKINLNYSTINNQLEGSYNFLVKFNKKINLKTELYLCNDIIQQSDKIISVFSNNVIFEDINNFSYKPFSKKIKLTFNYFLNEKSLIVIENIFQEDKVNSFLNQFQNGNTSFLNTIRTYSLFEKLKVDVTKKISADKAINFSSIFAFHNLPQNLIISNKTDDSESQNQVSNFCKVSSLNKIELLGNFNGFKYSLNVGINNKNTKISSELRSFKNLNQQNEVSYRTNNLFIEMGMFYKYKSLSISPTFKFNHLNQKFEDNVDNKVFYKSSSFINSNLSFKYLFNQSHQIILALIDDNVEPNDGNIYPNFILSSNRNLQKYDHSFLLQKNQNLNLTYRYKDEEKHLVFFAIAGYGVTKNNLISENSILDNYFVTTFFQDNKTFHNKTIETAIDKLISPLKTVVKGGVNYSLTSYNNVFEGKDRNNNVNNLGLNCFVNTVLEFPLNFQYKFVYNKMSFISNDISGEDIKSIENNVKMIYKFKKIALNSQLKIINPNLTDNTNFKILDLEIKFKIPKIKDLEFLFKGNNLLNVENYFENTSSDIQSTLFQSNIIPRHFLVHMTFKF